VYFLSRNCSNFSAAVRRSRIAFLPFAVNSVWLRIDSMSS